MSDTFFKTGIDIGSTTAKLLVTDSSGKIIFSEYRRHNTDLYPCLLSMLEDLRQKLGNKKLEIKITGSAGLGISERAEIPFIQEVVAASEVVKQLYPDVHTLIDIGGEDSKLIFFEKGMAPDIRMNGNCAGGTGAFIDQMAGLLNIPLENINEKAASATRVYPIASRCGVFAKTDVQNLISRKVPSEDIAASIFRAVSMQVLNALARGREIKAKVVLCGGPFTYLPELQKHFMDDLGFSEDDIVRPEQPALLPALGAALDKSNPGLCISIEDFEERLKQSISGSKTIKSKGLPALFAHQEDYASWKAAHNKGRLNIIKLEDYQGENLFLGIDSGSTTSKIVIAGDNGEILFHYYRHNKARTIETISEGLEVFLKEAARLRPELKIRRGAVTGYGEDLIKAAFDLDLGIVETIAHSTAARFFNPNVSFLLDIGGQDMKAIFINKGIINRIELNESCSSGCGSFIESFASSLGHEISDFAQKACQAKAPCDLGTRCTVFMNSRVKQSLRENSPISDIAAGLSISVIKNALYKVLKLSNTNILGEHIIAQGGTFKNPSVHRALEQLSGKEVIVPEKPEIMGAYGAALLAKEQFLQQGESANPINLENLKERASFSIKQMLCKGCENQCQVSCFSFGNQKKHYSGNKCEKIFSSKGEKQAAGENLYEYKNKLLFNRPLKASAKKKNISIGIPRILNMYRNFPFWAELFTSCGFDVKLSYPSTMQLYETGKGTIMSDSICFPAKLAHGHIYNLIDQNVDRIFFPITVHDQKKGSEELNSFNCPIVASYADVISAAINPGERHNLPFDAPPISFSTEELLQKGCWKYLKGLGVSKKEFKTAFQNAIQSYDDYFKELEAKGREIIQKSRANKELLIVLAGRPYHADPLINHRTPQILEDLGVNIISEDAVSHQANQKELRVLTQWAFPNRVFDAACWAAEQDENVQFVQLNSFGCGPDAIAVDECSEVLKSGGKNNTAIRVDDITSTGSIRLRLRSLIESLRLKPLLEGSFQRQKRIDTPPFTLEDKKRTILAPYFADVYSQLLPHIFNRTGYNFEILPEPDKESVNRGLKYVNNEICYPAIIVIGDLIKALESGKYKREGIALGITQTGGQCRASSYLSLLKKALLNAGYEDIPVISVTSASLKNNQPGFKIPWIKYFTLLLAGCLFSDSLLQMYNSSCPREKIKGSSFHLKEKYTRQAAEILEKGSASDLKTLLKLAVADFNKLELKSETVPVCGFVGEIYIKYNSFGHGHIVKWLQNEGIEVVIPPILDFFLQTFANFDINQRSFIKKAKWINNHLMGFAENICMAFINQTNKIMRQYRFYRPFLNMREAQKKATPFLNPVNQFGEGWLIPSSIAEMAEEGIHHVISVQPFGCIANQVISKGIEKKLRDSFPEMNFLFLDFDEGTSEVNVLNRLHFMVKNMKEQLRKNLKTAACASS